MDFFVELVVPRLVVMLIGYQSGRWYSFGEDPHATFTEGTISSAFSSARVFDFLQAKLILKDFTACENTSCVRKKPGSGGDELVSYNLIAPL